MGHRPDTAPPLTRPPDRSGIRGEPPMPLIAEQATIATQVTMDRLARPQIACRDPHRRYFPARRSPRWIRSQRFVFQRTYNVNSDCHRSTLFPRRVFPLYSPTWLHKPHDL